MRQLRAELWQPPRAHGDTLRERIVGPLELFYDLVVVVLVAQAAHHPAAHLSVRTVGQFATVFSVVWIAWFNGTLLHDLHGREDVRSRNSFLAQILLLVPLGAFTPGAGDVHGRAFAITAALLFVLLGFLWWRAGQGDLPEFVPATRLYVGAMLVLAAGLMASVPLSGGDRLIVWAAVALLYLASIAVVFTIIPGRFDATFAMTDALIERFGLFVIIVLGETDPTDARTLTVGIVCVLLVLAFSGPWTFAVLRRAVLDAGETADEDGPERG